MGVSIRQRDGAWWIYVCHQGRRRAKRIGPGKPGKQAARTAAEQIAARLALGDVGILEKGKVKVPSPTFEAVAKQWERVSAPNWKRGTCITYGAALRCHMLPAFGSLSVAEVTADRVEAWWVALRERGLSKKHLANLRTVLRAIFRRAVGQGLVTANPVERIAGRLGRSEREARQAEYLSREELTAMLAAAERVSPAYHPLLLVMATAGLRLGEAVGLQVGDLDAQGQQLHVRRTVRRAYISSPKTGKGRVVDIPGATAAVLARVREIRQAEAAVRGCEARWLFPAPVDDMPFSETPVRRALRQALRAAGVRKVRLHDLRHTYATLAIQAGVPLLTVSRQLGHENIATTADLYTHAVPGSNRAAAEVMEAILAGNQTQPPRNPLP